MARRVGLLVRMGRTLKGDQNFDLDPAIGGGVLAGAMLRRGVMALRGLLLAAGSGRFAFPVFVGRGVVVHNKRHLKLSSGVTIEDFCRLDCLGTRGVELAKGVTLRRGVHIEVTSVLRELGVGCIIGERVGFSEGCYIGAKGLLEIGADTMLGPGCVVVAESHRFEERARPIREQGETRLGVSLGSDCWIGAGATVLDGVTIHDGCVVGAGAVVTKSLPAYSVAMGVPARVTRSRQ